MFSRSPVCVFAIALASTVPMRAAGADMEFFEKKVRPLLTERCLECHSPEHKVKGGLRLDSREGWETGGDAGPALVPGKPEESLLITAVRYRDKDLQMPPKKRLSAEEIATLEQWVKLGAPDPRTGAIAASRKKQTGMSIEDGRKFWSYLPPAKIGPPAVKDTAWPRGAIDRFILAKIEEKGLRPGADATPEALVRRLYYALIGLPPTPEQVDHFVQAAGRDAQSAMAAAVDELLASPHFGEKWGRHWLDMARFAESSGGGRTLFFKDAWRYRDYVIEAFNRDQPFDRFIREQIAGDLLPAQSPEERRRQLTATAFLTLGPTNYEEQNKQQLRFDIIDEQLDTIGKVVLGQTIGCARCHDHKFDPIPQRDYYALAGILASTRTLFNYTDNVAKWIATPFELAGPEEQKLRAHEAKLASMKQDLDAARKDLAKAKDASAKANASSGLTIAAADLPGVVIDDSEAKTIGNWRDSTSVKGFIGSGYRTDDGEGKGVNTITFAPKIPMSGRFEVRFSYRPGSNRAKRVPIHIFHADGQETVFVDQSREPPLDGLFVTLGKFRFEQDGAGYVLVSNEGTTGHVVADAVQFIPEEEAGVAGSGKEARQPSPSAQGQEPDRKKEMESRVKTLEAEVKKFTSAGPHRPTAMTVREEDQIADTHLRVRGLVGQRGALIPRGFLQVLATSTPPVLSEKESGRRELADWLVSPENPLTARVFVNRVWNWLFGTGIVRPTENFGTTGEAPSHPELLDHLARRFVEQGWSVKRLIREMVLSHTWQLATGTTPGDPDNRLLAHANRRRLDAEQIRDTILTVSGELQLTVGGPNIAGANEDSPAAFEYSYEFRDTRRSVYTPAFRNKRLELFELFDFGDINAPVGRRNVSTVAPQALYLLNHPFVLAQSKLAAERALASSASDDEKLTNAFRAALGRPPREQERALCAKFVAGADGPRRTEVWSQVYQTLFGCVDFRYLE
jgi:hypothetical protein